MIQCQEDLNNQRQINVEKRSKDDTHRHTEPPNPTSIPSSSVVSISEAKQQVNDQAEISTADTEAFRLDGNGISKLSARVITCDNCTWQEYKSEIRKDKYTLLIKY